MCVRVCVYELGAEECTASRGRGSTQLPDASGALASCLSPPPISPDPPAWQTRHACVVCVCVCVRVRWDGTDGGGSVHTKENKRHVESEVLLFALPTDSPSPAQPSDETSVFLLLHIQVAQCFSHI